MMDRNYLIDGDHDVSLKRRELKPRKCTDFLFTFIFLAFTVLLSVMMGV